MWSKENNPEDYLFSEDLIHEVYYEDMFDLQQWVYEMTLTSNVD